MSFELPKCPCGSTKWKRESDIYIKEILNQETGCWDEDYSENENCTVYCAECGESPYIHEDPIPDEIDAAFDHLIVSKEVERIFLEREIARLTEQLDKLPKTP